MSCDVCPLAATVLADAAVTATISVMTYNVPSGTLNHTQSTNSYFAVYIAIYQYTAMYTAHIR